ncbi:MAG: hypothetical protein R3335_03990 [Anaerolineales bacterium]|nr:hypothetical protein [Anaerolineales bacterium]
MNVYVYPIDGILKNRPEGFLMEGDDLDSVPRSKNEDNAGFDDIFLEEGDDREDEPPVKRPLDGDADTAGDDQEDGPV